MTSETAWTKQQIEALDEACEALDAALTMGKEARWREQEGKPIAGAQNVATAGLRQARETLDRAFGPIDEAAR